MRPSALALVTLAVFSTLFSSGCMTTSAGRLAFRPEKARPSASLVDGVLFHPSKEPRGGWEPERSNVEVVSFTNADGSRFKGWFAEAEKPRAIVLYCEGNAGNITSRRWVLDLFRDMMRTSVLIFDYRGYGQSEGEPSRSGVLEDARAARAWLAVRTSRSDS